MVINTLHLAYGSSQSQGTLYVMAVDPSAILTANYIHVDDDLSCRGVNDSHHALLYSTLPYSRHSRERQ